MLSVEEYLSGEYSPEFEYVDGLLVETNVGDFIHASVKSNLILALCSKYPRVKVLPTLTTRITATRYRLPDICVVLKNPSGRYLEEGPLIAIEVLADADRATLMLEKLKDYSALGATNIWVLDPRTRQMLVFRGNALVEIEGDVIATESPRLELTRDEIFQD